MMSLIGEEGSTPCIAAWAAVDTSGGMAAAFGLTSALYSREKTGTGQKVDVAMLDVQIAQLSTAAANYLIAGLLAGNLGSRWPSNPLHGIFREAGHGEHIFGPPIHGIGIEFEEAPLPAGHAFFHGEKAPPPLPANVVIAVGHCGLYTGPWGVRVEDTVVVGEQGPTVLTRYPQQLH